MNFILALSLILLPHLFAEEKPRTVTEVSEVVTAATEVPEVFGTITPNIVQKNVKVIPAQYPADFTDDRALVGSAHNIFVGTVLEQTGTKSRSFGPETQFTVQVLSNVKGDLKGVVHVNQQAGERDGTYYIVGDGYGDKSTHAEFLQTGSTYLFATRFNETENWHTLISHPAALELITRGVVDSSSDFLASQSRVQELRNAYPNEKLLEVDVRKANTRNSYVSTRENQLEIDKTQQEVGEIGSESHAGDEEALPSSSEIAPAEETQ